MRKQYYRPYHSYTPRKTLPYRCRICEDEMGIRKRFGTLEELRTHKQKKHK